MNDGIQHDCDNTMACLRKDASYRSLRQLVMSAPVLENYIGGKFVASAASVTVDVVNPATQNVLCRVPISTTGEMQLH
jgi:hypothetical protein